MTTFPRLFMADWITMFDTAKNSALNACGQTYFHYLTKSFHIYLDFSIFLEPIDTMKYEYISLHESSRWGLLMMSDCELAKKEYIESLGILTVPLIFHRRAGLQRLISRWGGLTLRILT